MEGKLEDERNLEEGKLEFGKMEDDERQFKQFPDTKDLILRPLAKDLQSGCVPASRQYNLASAILYKYPYNIQAMYYRAEAAIGLQSLVDAMDNLERLKKLLPKNKIVAQMHKEISIELQSQQEKIRNFEIEMEKMPDSKFYYRWKPIEPIPENLMNFSVPEISESQSM